MREYSGCIETAVHLIKDDRVWCKSNNVNLEKTKIESEATCMICLKRLKKERNRINLLNKQRVKLGWELLPTI